MNRKIKNLIYNAALMVIVILLFFAFFEVILRFFSPQPCYYNPRYLYRETPDTCFEMAPNMNASLDLPDFNMDIKTNSMGLRDYEFNSSANRMTMLGLGDSMQFGFGVQMEETYLKLLEKKLNQEKTDKKYSVINAGISGYGTKQESIYFKDNALKFNPEAVFISFYIGNDFADNVASCSYSVKDGYLVQKGVSSFRIFLNKLNTYCFIKKRALGIPIIKNWLYKNPDISSINEMFYQNYSEHMQEEVDATQAALHDINEISRINKIKPVLIIIPHRAQVEERTRNKIQDAMHDYDFDKPNKVLKDYAKYEGFYVIDVTPAFRYADKNGIKLYFDTDNHINKGGHKLIAEILYDELIKSRIISR